MIRTSMCALAFTTIGFVGIPTPAYADPLTDVANVLRDIWPFDEEPQVEVDQEAVNYMAATLFMEARGEGLEGMRAVAHVIVNRMNHGGFGGWSVYDVVTSPWQFSPWNRGFRQPVIANQWQQDRWDEAVEISTEVLSGASVDPTNGALYFHATYVHPRWARGARGRTRIGNHIFYQNAGGRPIEPVPNPALVQAAAEEAAPVETAPAGEEPVLASYGLSSIDLDTSLFYFDQPESRSLN